MSALTLVMKEVDIDAEEFLNVRAYHSRGKESGKSFGDDVHALASPASSDDSSSVGSVGNLGSEEEPAAPTTGPVKKTDPWKDLKSLDVASNCKQTPTKNEKKDNKILHEGRNLLNLERNLQPHQWQLRSPLLNSLSFYTKPKNSIFEKSEAPDELMITCGDCKYREPLCLASKAEDMTCDFNFDQLLLSIVNLTE